MRTGPRNYQWKSRGGWMKGSCWGRILQQLAFPIWKRSPFSRISDDDAGEELPSESLTYRLSEEISEGADLCLRSAEAELLPQTPHHPRFKQEILFQHQAITTPHGLYCADLSLKFWRRHRTYLCCGLRHERSCCQKSEECALSASWENQRFEKDFIPLTVVLFFFMLPP